MARDRRRTLESYVQLYLREEIKAEALVRKLPGFIRFLPIAALFHAQVVNVSGSPGMRERRERPCPPILTSWRIPARVPPAGI